jgi:DNA-binding SARP family transcriptional activator/TolB-like protein
MIEIHTLGRTRVAVNGQPLGGEAAWPRSLALIVYMAREPGPDRRQEILGVLWPDREERRARRALNQLIYTLRKASPELDLESVSDALDFGKEVWLDIEEFDRRVEAGDLKGAVDLYEGPFLADLTLDEPEFDHWADRQRAEARRKFRKAALQLAADARQAGDHELAVSYCRRLAQADPLDDEAQHLLIECLYLRGDRAAALRQYEKYRTLLAEELEVEPLEHTLELVARIRGEGLPESGGREPAVSLARGEDAEREPTVALERPDESAEPEAGSSDVEGAAGTSGVVALLTSRPAIGLLGAIVGAVLAVWLWPTPDGVGADRAVAAGSAGGLTAVLPFEVHGMSSDAEALGEGVAQLLSRDLETLGQVATMDHYEVMERWEGGGLTRRDMLDREGLESWASEAGANRVVIGDIHESGEEVRIIAELIAADSGERLAYADVRGARERLFDLTQELATTLSRGAAPSG